MMQCIKTGAQIYIEQYGEYAWCDLHQDPSVPQVIYARITGRSFNGPINGCNVIHARIFDVSEWWDKGRADRDGSGASTLIAHNFINYGTEGTPI